MGQGTDSCGGWESDYDAYEENLATGKWITRDGEEIELSKMTIKHLYGARQVARRAAHCANFTCDQEKWDSWVELFNEEIVRREGSSGAAAYAPAPKAARKGQSPVRGVKVCMVCHCGVEYMAREADLSRGWGYSCSKSFAAKRREFGRPKAKRKVS